VSIVAVGLSFASAAWACAPNPGARQTKFVSCQQPAGASYACKPLLGTPPFPDATSIKGNRGATVVAKVSSGLFPGYPFNMIFVNKKELAAGTSCTEGTRVIGGPTLAERDQSLPPTTGTIPLNAPLGGGQVCFVGADGPTGGGNVADSGSSSIAFPGEPAGFKVIV